MPVHDGECAVRSTVATSGRVPSILAGEFAPVLAIVTLAVLALVGWWLDLPGLAGGLGELPVMTPAVALTFLASAFSLASWQKGRALAAMIAAGFVLVVGTVTLGAFFLGRHGSVEPGIGWHVAPQSALAFLLCGTALALLEGSDRRIRASQVMAGGASIVVAVAVIGHLLSVPELYSVSPGRGMSVTTALAFTALILGIDVRHLDRGYMAQILGRGSGALMLRELLPAALVLPALMALLLEIGEDAGLSYDPPAIVLIAGGMLVVVAAFLLRTARTIDRYERSLVEANADLEHQVAIRTTRLVESEQHLRQVLDNLSAFAGVLAPDGTVIEANSAPLKASGLTDEDVIGRKVWDCYWWNHSPELQEQVREVVRRVAQGESFRFDMKVRMPGDTRMWIDFQLVPLRDASGRITHLVPSAVDITARKHAEKALKSSERRYRALFENIDEGFCIIQVLFDETERAVDYRFVEVNRAFEKHTGLKNVAGRTARDVVPDMEEHWFHTYGKVALTGEPIRFVDHSSSMGRWFDLYAVRIGEPYERTVGVLFNDITERRKTEEALQEAGRHKDEFLAILSHELRNPLAPVRHGVEILSLTEKRGQPAPPSVLPMMERQIRHMGRLLDELLDVSRISLGRIELRRQRIDVADVIASSVDASRPLIEERGHVLEIALPPEPVFVDADPVRLSQVIGNLLNNAAKYMKTGGRISIRAERRSGDVVISVRDNGVGIDAQSLTSIFELFSRGRAAMSDTDGLGIGLALAKRLVTLHGGTVDVSSGGPGKGSEFFVRLPALDDPAVPRAEAPPSAAQRRLRILVVDDNEDAASALSVLLQMRGNEVRTANEGRAAIRLAADFLPDAVLLDLGMPEMDGCEVCRELRRLPGGEEMSVIALTGWGQDMDRRKTRAAGFDEHLVKPVDSHEMTRVLSEVCANERHGESAARIDAPAGHE